MKISFSFSTSVLLFVLVAFLSPTYGQWNPDIIDDDLYNATLISVGDLDDDGDLDVAASAWGEDAVFWYEYEYPTWTRYTIGLLPGAVGCDIADIDGDGKLDVISGGYQSHDVIWYKKNGSLWTANIIDNNLGGATEVCAGDIDGDLDIDVVVPGYTSDQIVWYENNNLTWSKYVIDESIDYPVCVRIADIDSDTDMDVVATAYNDEDVVWYENLGGMPISWTKHILDSNLVGVWGVYVADINGNDTLDIIAAAMDANSVIWYENNYPAWTKHTIDDNLRGARYVIVAHIDNDSDLDVVASGYSEHHLVWYENNNLSWNIHTIDENLSGANSIFAADFHKDGIWDIFATGEFENSLIFYDNLLGVAMVKSLHSHPAYIQPNGEIIFINAKLYNPENNPATVWAIIRGEQQAFTDSIQLYDDGEHNDSLASDNIWGNSIWQSGLPEDMYTIGVASHDITENYSYSLPEVRSFTSIGPIKIDSLSSPRQSPFDPTRIVFDIYLTNNGETATANNISALIIPDTTHECFVGTGSLYRIFGDIAPGESKAGLNFNLYLEESCLEDTVVTIPFSIDISSDGEVYWSDQYELIVDGIENISTTQPKTFKLGQNYPNPFNPITIINYELPIANYIDLSIYNMLGQRVATLVSEKKNAGYHQVEWDAWGFASGIYYYRIETSDFQDVKKMVLIR